MDKLLEAILLAAMPEQIKEAAKEPITVCFIKEEGVKVDATTTIIGLPSGVYAGLCALLPDALKAIHPDDPVRQKRTLDSVYRSTCTELGIKTGGPQDGLL